MFYKIQFSDDKVKWYDLGPSKLFPRTNKFFKDDACYWRRECSINCRLGLRWRIVPF